MISAANPSQFPPSFQAPANLPAAATATLENEYIRVTLTSNGGAIQKVELLKHQVDDHANVTLNLERAEPILNLIGWEPNQSLVAYEAAPGNNQPGASPIVFRRVLPGGAVVERSYQLKNKYQILLHQTVRNPGAAPLTLPAYQMNVGLSTPVYASDLRPSIGTGWMVQGGKYQSFGLGSFDPSGFWIFRGEPRTVITSQTGPLAWVAVKNQFFTSILTAPADLPIAEARATRQDLDPFPGPVPTPAVGIHTVAGFPALTIPADGQVAYDFDLYAGPKEYEQLKSFDQGQSQILEFGFFSWLVKPLLTLMSYVHHGVFGLHWNLNYGWVIIIVTLLIKGMLWPLQSAANRSMKGMQVLQPRIKELQEKYKDDPQKMQTELMKVYQEYGINPIGGCLPMLVQLPILLAFYSMLQNAIELRHVSWLWVKDLSHADTIFSLYGIDFNPLPIAMTLTQLVLMRMTPNTQDNPQMKIMQWMPLVFLFMLYKFAAALSLYWTVSNLVTIIQTYRNLKKPLPKLERKKKPLLKPFQRKNNF